MRLFILVNILFIIPLMAQEDLAKKRQQILQDIEKEKQYLVDRNKQEIEEVKELKELQQKLTNLKFLKDNRPAIKREVEREISAKLDSYPVHRRIFSREFKFYKCLNDHLKRTSYISVEICQRSYPIEPDQEMSQEIKQWHNKIGYSDKGLTSELGITEKSIERLNSSIAGLRSGNKTIDARITHLNKSLVNVDAEIEDEKFLKANPQMVNCDSSSPTINLEEKVPYDGAKFSGPFYGIPRDHQDGLGTCYANAAKNLLVSLSGGEMNASFLDMALHFKDQWNSLASDGLEAGNSCSTLEQIEKVGVCDQAYAPIESGEKNHAFAGLLGPSPGSLYAEEVTLDLLKDFIGDIDKLKKSDSPLSVQILNKAQGMIKTLHENPKIKYPLPVVRYSIPSEWKLQETAGILKRQGKDEKVFMEDYKKGWKEFLPKYVNALLEGKNLDQVFDLYKTSMASFISKYSLEESLTSFKQSWQFYANRDMQGDYKQELKESLEFLKVVVGQQGLSNDEILDYCSNNFELRLDFLSRLGPLMEKLNERKVDPSILFDKDGNFLSARDLMQLAVAPACINKENRKKIDFEFSCDNGYTFANQLKASGKPKNEKIMEMRKKVVSSLRQGLAVGNIHPQRGGSHINTIVGIRFNPETQRCEYRIRESQNATSFWQTEESIFDKLSGLTIVRKK